MFEWIGPGSLLKIGVGGLDRRRLFRDRNGGTVSIDATIGDFGNSTGR